MGPVFINIAQMPDTDNQLTFIRYRKVKFTLFITFFSIPKKKVQTTVIITLQWLGPVVTIME